MKILITFFVLLSLETKLLASTTPTEEMVVKSMEEHYPVIKQTFDEVAMAEGELKTAKGAFDTKIVSNNYQVPTGYFKRKHWDVMIEKKLPIANSKIYAGYSKGFEGKWPDQYSTEATNSGGTPRIGASLSLLRGFIIDENRAQYKKSQFGLEQMKAQKHYTRITLKRDAALAYWDWLVAVYHYQIYSELLGFAESRKSVLEQRVNAGDISGVVAKENLQYYARRQAELASAELNLKQKVLDLSLFYRDQEAKPIVVEQNNVEGMQEIFLNKIEFLLSELESNKLTNETNFSIQKRPDLYSISQQMAMNDVSVRLAENAYWPKLDIGGDYSNNIGDEDPTNAPKVVTVFLQLEIPIEYNLIKGQVQNARAENRFLKSRYHFATEIAQNEIAKLNESIRLSKVRMDNAKLEMTYAQELLEAENYKFTKGGSNFFLINIREEALAEAKSNLVLSKYDVIKSFLDYKVATSQL